MRAGQHRWKDDNSPLQLQRSAALLVEAEALIPGLTQSLMKRPAAFAPGAFPGYLKTGEGPLVQDVDGTWYIDYICGLGANSLGHRHPQVLSAIEETLGVGLLHSLPTALEVGVTRSLVEMIPGAEQARLFKTGADATSAAVRLARHLTGRDHIVTVGYNGFHDHFMCDTPGVPAGVARYTTRMPLFAPADEPALLQAVSQRASELAAVVLSLPYNRVLTADYLRQLGATCRQHGVLLVLDEVVTGFRLARGGAQEFYGIQADLVCLSKGLAAGMPLSAIVGPARHLAAMAELQVSTTFGGECLSLAVCAAALRIYRETDAIAQAAQLGRRLREGVNLVAERCGAELRVVGYDAIPMFRFASDPLPPTPPQIMPRFTAEMAKRGVLLRRDANFISLVHRSEHIDYTIEAAGEALVAMTG